MRHTPFVDQLPRPFEERDWTCRTCGRKETAAAMPKGWYAVYRLPGDDSLRRTLLGLWCNAACMTASMPAIEKREAVIGDDWDYPPREEVPR